MCHFHFSSFPEEFEKKKKKASCRMLILNFQITQSYLGRFHLPKSILITNSELCISNYIWILSLQNQNKADKATGPPLLALLDVCGGRARSSTCWGGELFNVPGKRHAKMLCTNKPPCTCVDGPHACVRGKEWEDKRRFKSLNLDVCIWDFSAKHSLGFKWTLC